MKKLLQFVDVYFLAGTAGAGLLLYGVAQWSRPLAFVVAGLLLLALSFAPVLRRPKQREG